ncbi:MAG: hypothetical protein ACRC1K_21075, partial [Planctomycetia bacterium]
MKRASVVLALGAALLGGDVCPGQPSATAMVVEVDGYTPALAGKLVYTEGVYSGLLGRGPERAVLLQRCKVRFVFGEKDYGELAGNVEVEGTVRV